jgi:hypothetical protein
MKDTKKMNYLILILTLISFISCQKSKEDKEYFIFLYKLSKDAPHDLEAKEIYAKKSDNLIKIKAHSFMDGNEPYSGSPSFEITLPKDVKSGVYTQLSPNIYVDFYPWAQRGHNLDTFNLKILDVNEKTIKGVLEGKYENSSTDFISIENGKFCATFSEE